MKRLLVLGFIVSTLTVGLNAKADTPKRASTARSLYSVKTRIGEESVTLKVSPNKSKQLDLWARQLSRLPKSKADAFKGRLAEVSRIESKKQKSRATRKLLTEYGAAKCFPPNGEGPTGKVTIIIDWPPYFECWLYLEW